VSHRAPALLAAAAAATAVLVTPIGSAAGPCAPRAKAAHRHHTAVRCSRIRRVTAARRLATERIVPLSLPAPVLPPTPAPAPPAPTLGRYVSVTAKEYTFTLSRPVVAAGQVTVELRNKGEDPHNLVVSPDDGSHTQLASWADADPDAVVPQKLTLPAGDYRLWCSLLDHESRGMSVRLEVR
jgi:plastocyanin